MTWLPMGRRRTLFAVSGDGIGLLAGTLAPSRREAIAKFQLACPPGSFALDWSKAKNAGYRTVRAVLEIRTRDGMSTLPDRDCTEAANEIERLRHALKQISDGAENQNIGHKEFRVDARHCADTALRNED